MIYLTIPLDSMQAYENEGGVYEPGISHDSKRSRCEAAHRRAIDNILAWIAEREAERREGN